MTGSARPEISLFELSALLKRRYGFEGDFSELPGDRDRNFLFRSRNGAKFVAKISFPAEPRSILRFEAKMVALLGKETDGLVPPIVPALDGALLVDGTGLVARSGGPVSADGGSPCLRLIEHVEGTLLASISPRPVSLLGDLGGKVARLTSALGAVPDHPPARKEFGWALGNAGLVMERALPLLSSERKGLLGRVLKRFDRMAPRFLSLGSQMIHGDINDHNVLVRHQEPDRGEPDHADRSSSSYGLSVAGIIDLGDAHSAPRVFDLAIAIAYGIFDTDDPLVAAQAMTSGFHGEQPLLESEIDVIWTLVRARLGQSVAIAMLRRKLGEVDDYHLVSERPAWEMLGLLDEVNDALATGFLRRACGMEPVPACAPLRKWLRDRAPAPVVDLASWDDLGVLDLSVGSTELGGLDTDDVEAFTRRIANYLGRNGWKMAVGRYLEPRSFYLSPAFGGREGDPRERRTIHLGLDLFAPAGTLVYAPLDGRVASLADNAARLDYGPTVVLEHDGPQGPFWTLYGHLSRESLTNLRSGDEIAAGRTFATLGSAAENGGWPPHLHLQVIVDRLGYEADFPGVALPREGEVWASLSPDPNLLLGLPCETAYRDPSDLGERRKKALGGNLSLSYADPIHMARGRGAYLYDSWGREYLDCVNNPAHVGHEHPHVVRAGRRQMAVLNTNTRYLHPLVIEYAERLVAQLPSPLSVCWFVNSGSEANELALRLARAYTGARGVVVLEGGYHGHTTGLVELSHYKRPEQVGRDPALPVAVALMPDPYRGAYLAEDPDCARLYALSVGEAFERLVARGHGAAAFLAESVMSCGGQIECPDGYLERAFRAAREAGAACIADEVQVGFGRMGSHGWGFQAAGAVPDIVTLGKPMGNGHPIGAVVATPRIAERFAREMEFFSTFGGNPVSAAIGLAVLEVMEEEDLQRRALEVGGHLKSGLAKLAERYEAIGDVRGRGLFLGIEFVRSRESRRPDGDMADRVVEIARGRGVLLSTDGPDGNVIKIKPPMVFSREDADRVVGELERALRWLGG